MLSIVTRSADETHQIGENLGRGLSPHSVVALSGELGSGKTTFIQGIGRGLGIRSLVKSPSFVIIHEYPGPLPLYHFDLYRMINKQEILSLGYEEYFYQKNGVVVIEWADKMEDLLPREYLKIRMRIIDLGQRRIDFQPQGPLYERILKKIREKGRL